MHRLFTAQNTDGYSISVGWSGGEGVLFVAGATDGAVVSLEASPDGGVTHVPVTGVALNDSVGTIDFRLPPCGVRLSLTGAGASTSVSAWIGKLYPSFR